jgi:hypothetical protein
MERLETYCKYRIIIHVTAIYSTIKPHFICMNHFCWLEQQLGCLALLIRHSSPFKTMDPFKKSAQLICWISKCHFAQLTTFGCWYCIISCTHTILYSQSSFCGWCMLMPVKKTNKAVLWAVNVGHVLQWYCCTV